MNAVRANAMVAQVFSKLGDRFKICTGYPAERNWVFGIVEKAKPGEFFDDVTERLIDGSIRKLRLKDHGGIAPQQMEVIETTSSTIEEGSDRIIDLIIHKRDTTQLVPQKMVGLSADQVRELIALAIEADRKQRTEQQASVESVLHKVSEIKAAEPPPLTGLQQKPKVSRHEQSAAKATVIQTWIDRAHLLGMKPPRLNAAGNVDGRWLKFAQPAWESYLKNQQPTEVTA